MLVRQSVVQFVKRWPLVSTWTTAFTLSTLIAIINDVVLKG